MLLLLLHAVLEPNLGSDEFSQKKMMAYFYYFPENFHVLTVGINMDFSNCNPYRKIEVQSENTLDQDR